MSEGPKRTKRKDPEVSEKKSPLKTRKRKRRKVVAEPTEAPLVVKEDGSPRTVKMDGTPDQRGGTRPGAGRKPRHQRLTNYDAAMNILDDSIVDALGVLVNGLTDDDKYYRKACAELLLKKSIADKKQNELTGPGGGAIQIAPEDLEAAVLQIDHMINDRIQDAEFTTTDEE